LSPLAIGVTTYITLEEFVVFQAILNSSLKILYDDLSPGSCANTNPMPTLHRLFRSFDALPYDGIFNRKQGADKALSKRTVASLFDQ